MSRGVHHANYSLRGELNLHFTGAGSVVLVDGAATALGAPLRRNALYSFARCGIPIVCHVLSRVHVEGEFTATETALMSSVTDDLHALLDAARVDASIASRDGPRVLVVGEQNTGKSTLCRTLANLATVNGQHGVALIDTDVGQQGITCSGNIATVFMENPAPIDEGFNTMMPLSFFYGDKSVTAASRKRYLDLCAAAEQASMAVAAAKPKYSVGGIIVNTMGWTSGIGKDILFELVSIFAITHVIVCGSDHALAEEMQKAAIGQRFEILMYPKQARIFPRGSSQKSEYRAQQMVNYFCGTVRTPLSPYRGVAYVKDVQFVDAVTLETLSRKNLKPLSLAAVVWADSLETVGDANVAGFIILLEVGAKFFSFLSPASGSLPKPFLLVSPSIKLPASKVPPLSAT